MRISVTTIERFRNYLNGTITEQDLLSSIKGEYTPSRYMQLGTAFHAILEMPTYHYNPHTQTYMTSDGFVFTPEVIEPCIEVMDYDGAFEQKTTKDYEVEIEWETQTVTVVAKCDQLIGNMVIENKTKWSPFTQASYDNYANSCQWKFYMDIFQVERVRYNIFCMKDETSTMGIKLDSIQTFDMHDYPNLQQDIQELLSNFCYYINTRKLSQYFKEKTT